MPFLTGSTPIESLPVHLQELGRKIDQLPAIERQSASDGDGRVSPSEAYKARYYRSQFESQLGGVSREAVQELESVVKQNAKWSLPNIGAHVLAGVVLVLAAPFVLIGEWTR